MNRLTPCHYSIVRFVPFAETEEFANIGVVLFAPEFGVFDFRLEYKHTARITHFFHEIHSDRYKSIIFDYQEELDRYKHSFARSSDLDAQREAFKGLTKQRDGLIQFSSPRLLLTKSVETEVDTLFEHYVLRNFVTNEYQEKVLEKRVRTWLDAAPNRAFKAEEFGEGLHSLRLPFVARNEGQVTHIIKPFFLGQRNATGVIDHAWVWKGKIERVREFLPVQVVFAVQGHEKKQGTMRKAYDEAVGYLKDTQGIRVLEDVNKEKLLQYTLQ